jgi:hypothetical protein
MASPIYTLPDGIEEGSAAVAPIKPDLAFLISRPLHGIEPLDVVDHGDNALREFPH